MVDSPGKMLYNRKSRKKQRTVRLVQGEEGELAVKQKKTASMKQKFAYMAVTMVAASLGVFLCLYLVVSGIRDRPGRLWMIMTGMPGSRPRWRQKRMRSAIGLRETMGNAREELEKRIRETTKLLKNYEEKRPGKDEVYVLCGH